jgi:hypothetical protein
MYFSSCTKKEFSSLFGLLISLLPPLIQRKAKVEDDRTGQADHADYYHNSYKRNVPCSAALCKGNALL